jgi:hypothetical protein
MTSDLDIYRAANLVIKRYGSDAVIEAARMVDRMLELDDLEGRDLWRRIRRAILVLQAPAVAIEPHNGQGIGRGTVIGRGGIRDRVDRLE